jgi:hypothetical protein
MADSAQKKVRLIKFVVSGRKSIPIAWTYAGRDAEYAATQIEKLLRTNLSARAEDTLQFHSTKEHGALLGLTDIAHLILQGSAHEHTELDEAESALNVQLVLKKGKAPAASKRGKFCRSIGALPPKASTRTTLYR